MQPHKHAEVIKPEPRKGWYRVALLKNGVILTADNCHPEKEVSAYRMFERWLTPRIEYEVED